MIEKVVCYKYMQLLKHKMSHKKEGGGDIQLNYFRLIYDWQR